MFYSTAECILLGLQAQGKLSTAYIIYSQYLSAPDLNDILDAIATLWSKQNGSALRAGSARNKYSCSSIALLLVGHLNGRNGQGIQIILDRMSRSSYIDIYQIKVVLLRTFCLNTYFLVCTRPTKKAFDTVSLARW